MADQTSPARARGDLNAGKKARIVTVETQKSKNDVFLPRIYQLNADRFWSYLVTPIFTKRVAGSEKEVAKPLREASKSKSRLPEVVKYDDIINLSCISKQMRLIVMQHVVEMRTRALRETQKVERELRSELSFFWKSQWQRFQDVTEENRRLRYLPVEQKEESDEEEVKAPDVILTELERMELPKGLSQEEAKSTLKELHGLDSVDIEHVARRELLHLKAAFAGFYTSWSRAASIAPTVSQQDDFKKHLFAMAGAPREWNTKDWVKQAVYSVMDKNQENIPGGAKAATSSEANSKKTEVSAVALAMGVAGITSSP